MIDDTPTDWYAEYTAMLGKAVEYRNALAFIGGFAGASAAKEPTVMGWKILADKAHKALAVPL